MKAANLAVRFLLELCALASLAWWGAETSEHALSSIALALGVPLVAALAWGLVVSPKRRVDIPVVRWVVEIAVFGGAAAALVAVGAGGLALALVAVYAVNRILVSVWRQ